jgi:hypothetical protein
VINDTEVNVFTTTRSSHAACSTAGSEHLGIAEGEIAPAAASIAACEGAAGAAEQSARRRLTAFV